jgi:hypothetical protein
MLLILVGSRLEPLRSDNFDFALVGPTWLAILAFTTLALLQGMLVVALAERWLPGAPTALARHVTTIRIAAGALVLVALPGFVTALAEILD